jgi:hypothetical protein
LIFVPFCGSIKFQAALLLSLVIDLADDSQLETAGYRVNAHHEIAGPTRSLEPARASKEAEDALINSGNWIKDSVNLNLKFIAVGSSER